MTTEYNFRTVDLDEGLDVTPRANDIIDKVHSMGKLGLPQVWIFEGDDGIEDYQTCESLLDYVDSFGGKESGKLIRLESYDIELIHKESISSGRFLFQLD